MNNLEPSMRCVFSYIHIDAVNEQFGTEYEVCVLVYTHRCCQWTVRNRLWGVCPRISNNRVYLYVYTCLCIRTYVSIYTYIRVYLYVYTWYCKLVRFAPLNLRGKFAHLVPTYVYTYARAHTHTHMYIYTHTYIKMHACIRICDLKLPSLFWDSCTYMYFYTKSWSHALAPVTWNYALLCALFSNCDKINLKLYALFSNCDKINLKLCALFSNCDKINLKLCALFSNCIKINSASLHFKTRVHLYVSSLIHTWAWLHVLLLMAIAVMHIYIYIYMLIYIYICIYICSWPLQSWTATFPELDKPFSELEMEGYLSHEVSKRSFIVFIYVCMWLCMYVCMYFLFIHVFMYACMHACMYTYI
jgi:hypothetical protein